MDTNILNLYNNKTKQLTIITQMMKTIETETFYEPPKAKALEIKAHGLMCISEVTDPFIGDEEDW